MCIGCFSFLCLSVRALMGTRTIVTCTAPDVLVITQLESVCCREGLEHDARMPSQSCKTCLRPPWFQCPQKDSFSEPYITLMPAGHNSSRLSFIVQRHTLVLLPFEWLRNSNTLDMFCFGLYLSTSIPMSLLLPTILLYFLNTFR